MLHLSVSHTVYIGAVASLSFKCKWVANKVSHWDSTHFKQAHPDKKSPQDSAGGPFRSAAEAALSKEKRGVRRTACCRSMSG